MMEILIILFFAFIIYHFIGRDIKKNKTIQDLTDNLNEKDKRIKDTEIINKQLNDDISKLKDENRVMINKV